ncbi:MAG: hypothetical protein ACLQF1_14395 [Methyloceanibacter sp.]
MFLNSRFQLMTIAAAGALVVLTAANAPARALEPISHLGPVGPYEPILATVGSKRVIAFYVPDSGRCSINAVVFDSASPETPYSASRVRINLWPARRLPSTARSRNRSISVAARTLRPWP